MDYQWYFPQTSGGGGGGDTDKTDMQTDTITVTEDMTSTDWKTDRINSDELAYQIDAYREEDGQINPVEVDVQVTVSKSVTAFMILWATKFKGFINITTWRKK